MSRGYGRRVPAGPRLVLLVALAFLPARALPSAAQDSTLTRALTSHASVFDLGDGSLGGPGADTLTRIARENQFLLIGEAPHGMREPAQFVEALFAAARTAGYRHLAVEAGPLTTRMLENLMRGPDPSAALVSFLSRHTPFTVPFFNWREEADMLAAIVNAQKGQAVLWGLDQEFILSPTQHFERLAQLAPTDRARSVARRYAMASAEADRRTFSEKNPADLWMISAPDDSLARLTEAFSPHHGTEADTILEELAESRAIYHLYFARKGYASNLRRTELMKRHFVSCYDAARALGEDRPRVVLKLGANHVIRGPSTTDTYEIGSFVPELATALGGRSFSMLVLAAGGTVNAYRPFGSALADTAQRYDPAAPDAEDSFVDVKTILASANPSHWTLFELRPLRAEIQDGDLQGAGEKLKRTLLSFDAIVVVPEGHAARLLVAP